MHKILSASPCPALREYVRAFAQREIDAAGPEIVQPVPACLEPTLEFDFRNPPLVEYDSGALYLPPPLSIVGPHTYRLCNIRLRGPTESFGIFFQPLGVWQLFQIPSGLLINHDHAGHDIFGSQIRSLWERLAEAPSFAARVRLAEEFLLRPAAHALARTPVMNTARHIFHHPGQTRISDLANRSALSFRQFERSFSAQVGMPPKLFARITRYQMALDAKVTSPGRSWLTIAHEFGYHDQMHMIRDFQDFSGDSPSRVLVELGDMRPEALAAPLPATTTLPEPAGRASSPVC